MTIFLYLISAVIILAGFAGIFLPMIPGISLMFVGMLMAMIVAKFSFISNFTVVILAILTIISFIIDYFSGVIGAKYSGASTIGVVGAIFGSVFGAAIFGPIGVLVGPAVGVLIFETLSGRGLTRSVRPAGFTLLSTIIGMIINGTIGALMLIIFVGAIFL